MLQIRGMPLFPRSDGDDQAAGIRDLRIVDEVESAERDDVRDARNLLDVVGDAFVDRINQVRFQGCARGARPR